jgi:hypothetical protein
MNRNANRMAFALAISLLLVSAVMAQIGEKPAAMDTKTVRQWSVPYRGWHYYPDHVIPGKPNIKEYEAVQMTDVPTVFQLPDCGAWERDCIYQPWLVEHRGKFYNLYNAANGHIEQMGLRSSSASNRSCELVTSDSHCHRIRWAAVWC